MTDRTQPFTLRQQHYLFTNNQRTDKYLRTVLSKAKLKSTKFDRESRKVAGKLRIQRSTSSEEEVYDFKIDKCSTTDRGVNQATFSMRKPSGFSDPYKLLIHRIPQRTEYEIRRGGDHLSNSFTDYLDSVFNRLKLPVLKQLTTEDLSEKELKPVVEIEEPKQVCGLNILEGKELALLEQVLTNSTLLASRFVEDDKSVLFVRTRQTHALLPRDYQLVLVPPLPKRKEFSLILKPLKNITGRQFYYRVKLDDPGALAAHAIGTVILDDLKSFDQFAKSNFSYDKAILEADLDELCSKFKVQFDTEGGITRLSHTTDLELDSVDYEASTVYFRTRYQQNSIAEKADLAVRFSKASEAIPLSLDFYDPRFKREQYSMSLLGISEEANKQSAVREKLKREILRAFILQKYKLF